ncbi:MAG: hypothetical protein EOP22_13580 [Hyphomicrobiales bacterium]|nr:MAG: hypothetical protein EOP22_13580 [Hyphomicrobiales bacterium]
MTNTAPLPEALAERLAFSHLDSEALGRVKSVEAGVLKYLGPALDRFYAHLGSEPQVAKFFADRDQLQRAKGAQSKHWTAIAGGQLDASYFDSSYRIGRRHAQIGLEPRWYIGGYGLIAETIIKGLISDFFEAQAAKPRGMFARRDEQAERQEIAEFGESVAALVKSILVDVDIAVTTYFDRLTAEAAAQQKASSDKIALAVTSVGDVLRQVAEGDLTARVTADLDPELEQINRTPMPWPIACSR